MLNVNGIDVFYGDVQVLWGVSLHVGEGEIVALLGPNGSGKSTILNTVAGLLQPKRGQIEFLGREVAGVPAFRRAGNGLALVLERHRLFPLLTVRQNLHLGAYRGEARKNRAASLEWVEGLFPVLRQRANQQARTLSGGEQQMVALARGLMSRPRLLMVDEPTLGLSPKVAAEVIELLQHVRKKAGITVVFVEQNVQLALSFADRGYVLESGRVLAEGSSADLLHSSEVKRVFLGVAG